uniref:aldehyde dehydrogenase family protein n=1 Tax=Rhizobium bangladeshense TaxID=1138189 RepID=UPI000AE545CB
MTIRINNYIGGKDVGASVDEFGVKINPGTGEKLEEVTYSSAVEVKNAIDVADEAFSGWRDMRPSERGRVMVELGRVIRANEKRLGEIE